MRQSRTLGSVGGGARQRPLLPGRRAHLRARTIPDPGQKPQAAYLGGLPFKRLGLPEALQRNAMLTLAQDEGRRIWVILDELPTLHQVPSLQPGLAESRQFGGCFVLGVQVASALRDLYGRNGAETISGLCGTRVVLAAPDRDTAQWSADSLGRSEVEEVAEGYSYGANTIRDGVSLTPRRELRALALPSEIMRLPNLEGYLKFPGPLPVASIRLKYVARPAAAERFVPRDADTAQPRAEKDDADNAGETPPEPVLWPGELEFVPAELPPEPEYPNCVYGARAGGEDEAASPADGNDPAGSDRKEAPGAIETLPATKAGQGAAATAVECDTGGWY